MELRPYQQEAVEAVYDYLRKNEDNPCVVCPTGCGKTIIIAQIVKDAVKNWQGRVLVLAHVKELLEQNADKIIKLCPDLDIGIYSAGLRQRDTDNQVIVAGIQSIYKRAQELGSFDLIIIDECHLIPHDGEGTYRTFLAAAKAINPNVRIIGLTATPYRLKGGVICKPENILNSVCYEANIRDMIAQGYLTPLKSRGSKNKADLSNLKIRSGEFIASEIEQVMDNGTLVRNACAEIVELTAEKNSVLIFTSGIKHCTHVTNELEKLTKQEVGMITGDTPSGEREETLLRFKGETIPIGLFGEALPPLKYLANISVLTTGFDAPNVDCVVLLRPTASPGLYVQMIGRGTRLFPGKKDCLILDYGGNVMRHGPVDVVSVDEKKPLGGEAPAKECEQCLSIIHAACRVCPECGFKFPEPETEIENTAGSDSILSGEITDTEHEVVDTSYFVHSKYGADESAPKTLRVEYQVGFYHRIKDWLCPEHTGWPRRKFEKWWKERSVYPPPATAAEAAEMAELGALAPTYNITVRSVSGEKYDRVIRCELGEKPDGEMKQLAVPTYPSGCPEDDIPF